MKKNVTEPFFKIKFMFILLQISFGICRLQDLGVYWWWFWIPLILYGLGEVIWSLYSWIDKFSPFIYLSNYEIFNIYEYTSFRQLSLRMLYNISLKFKSAANFLLVLMSSLLHSYFYSLFANFIHVYVFIKSILTFCLQLLLYLIL